MASRRDLPPMGTDPVLEDIFCELLAVHRRWVRTDTRAERTSKGERTFGSFAWCLG